MNGVLAKAGKIGTQYPKMFAIRPGDRLVTYGGFHCIAGNTIVTIESDSGGMFFRCADGRHYLESQKTEDGACLGLSVTAIL
jgi:hypothetical protein